MRHLTVVILLSAMLTACTAGRDFPPPTPDRIVLGTTTRDEILNTYGPPRSQKQQIRATAAEPVAARTPFSSAGLPGKYDSLTYAFANALAARTEGGSVPARAVSFTFFNERLISYAFISTFAEDSTNFDESRIGTLEKGQSTKTDVILMLGQPGGRAIYPTAATMGDEILTYTYTTTNVATRQRSKKTLQLLFDGDGRMRDYRFDSESNALPPPAAAPVVVPIVVPRGR